MVVERFGFILCSVVLILIGLNIIVLHYGFADLATVIAFDLIVVGITFFVRGFAEPEVSDRKFYAMWGSIFIDLSLSIIVAGVFNSFVIGLATFFIGLGVVLIFTAVF